MSSEAARTGGRGVPGIPAAMPYLPQLDGVRAVAALIVFVAHAGFSHIVPGGFGVTVFFFLSGYLITTLLRIERARTGRVSLPAFYLRRTLRILPPMYLTLLVSGAVYALGLMDRAVDGAAVIGQATFLTNYPALWGTEQVLPVPLWSLAIEEHFYLVFPLAYALWLGRRSPGRAALICLATCGLVLGLRALNVWRLADYSLNYSWTHTRIDAILFGCCLGLWQNPVCPGAAGCVWAPRPWQAAAALALILGTLLVRDEAFRQSLRYTLQSAALFVIFSAILQGRGPIVRFLACAPMRWLGLYSYSFYLAHATAFALVWHLAPGLGRLGGMAASFVLTLAYAALMYAAVERPCARLRRRLLDGGGRPPEPSLADGVRAAEAPLTRA
ncbi:acyltransferase family protein [Methylobacterium planeticum]|uniref:Acyltransferase n=1 Tax=Methylobacterium planeticum TaxID=2615211 RepID=A0A6N6MWS4_9HYPH|nr:acyltransferase [Methylobacterium planeticum]KAB1075511.1 acyltransferase [Methylobacterium planeticum]